MATGDCVSSGADLIAGWPRWPGVGRGVVVVGGGQAAGQPAGEDAGAERDREVGAGLFPGEGPDLVEQAARVPVGEPPGGLPGLVRGLPGQVGRDPVLFGVPGHPGQFVGQRVQTLGDPLLGGGGLLGQFGLGLGEELFGLVLGLGGDLPGLFLDGVGDLGAGLLRGVGDVGGLLLGDLRGGGVGTVGGGPPCIAAVGGVAGRSAGAMSSPMIRCTVSTASCRAAAAPMYPGPVGDCGGERNPSVMIRPSCVERRRVGGAGS